MMTDDQILEVVQAHKEGKKIQHRFKGDDVYKEGGWGESTSGMQMAWNFSKYDYRVAPEPPKPREWLLCDGTGHERWEVVNEIHVNDALCQGERVRVREVIGASSGNPTVASDTASCNQ